MAQWTPDGRSGEEGAARRRRATRASGGEPRRRVVPMPSAASRSSSCSAALRLKASIRMPDGSAPRSTSSTTRLTRVLVLPEPAGARTRAAPRRCSTAARWASSSRAAPGPAAGRRAGAAGGGDCRGADGSLAVGNTASGFGDGLAGTEQAASSSRPMSSRSRRAASATTRPRGASTSGPKGKPRQKGRPRARRGWTKRRSTSFACAAKSSAVSFQSQRPTGASPPRSGRRGSPGSSVHVRWRAKRRPGPAAAARCARSRRPVT